MSFRVEEKIPLTPSDAEALRARLLDDGMTPLFPPRRIRSVYFETDDRTMFRASEEGVLPRMKIRLRCYPDTASGWALERKTSSIEGRFKTTDRLSPAKAVRLLRRGVMEPNVGFVTPLLEVEYQRSYYDYCGQRITFDAAIRYAARVGGARRRDPYCVTEIKAAYEISPGRLAKLIATPRGRFSKYCNAVRLLDLGV